MPDTAGYIFSIPDFVFSYIYENYSFVDSVLDADKAATSAVGSTTSDVYYQKLWELSSHFTLQLFSKASSRLASLIYTAWIDAGSPDIVTGVDDLIAAPPLDFYLYQNYPNPFNPSTTIRYQIPVVDALSSAEVHVTLKVYNVLGMEVTTLVNEFQQAGRYSVQLSAIGHRLTSGIYFYRLTAGSYSSTKKMILLR